MGKCGQGEGDTMTLRYAESRHKAELLQAYLEDTHGIEWPESWNQAEQLMSDIHAWIAFRENGWRLADRVKGGKG